MRRTIYVMLMIVSIIMLSFPDEGYSQDVNVIEKLDILGILSLEMHPASEQGGYVLEVSVAVHNKNELALRLTNNVFEFLISAPHNLDEKVYVGPDISYTQQEILLEPNTVTPLMFTIQLGTKDASALESGIALMNFLGNLSEKRRFFIDGRFTLGVKSERGWSEFEAVRVEWVLCSLLRPQLPLKPCFVKEPEVAETVPISVACNEFVKAGRRIVIPRADPYLVELGRSAGTLQLHYQTYTEPDRMVIEYEGKVVLDTGCIGAEGNQTFTYAGSATQMKVTIYSRCAFVGPSCTDWDFTLACPQ